MCSVNDSPSAAVPTHTSLRVPKLWQALPATEQSTHSQRIDRNILYQGLCPSASFCCMLRYNLGIPSGMVTDEFVAEVNTVLEHFACKCTFFSLLHLPVQKCSISGPAMHGNPFLLLSPQIRFAIWMVIWAKLKWGSLTISIPLFDCRL